MKWLILLIIANIGVFMWGTMTQNTISSEGLLGLSDMDTIQLVEEKRPRLIAEAKKKNKLYATNDLADVSHQRGLAKGKAVNKELAPELAENFASCQRIEYFKNESIAKRAKKILFLQTIAATIRKAENMEQILGYYALIPPSKNLRRAKVKFDRLEKAGFNDLWLFRTGNLKYGISLGFFNSKNKTKKMVDKAIEGGFDAEIKPKVEKTTLYYLTFNQSKKDQVDLTLLEKTLELNTKLHKNPCDG